MWDLNPPNRAVFIVIVVFLPIATLALILRLLVLLRTRRKPAWEDWFAVLAWVTFVIQNALVLVAVKLTGDKNPTEIAYTDPIAFEQGRKWTVSASYLFTVQQVLAKLSIAALYLRIFGVDHNYRMIIWALVALLGVGFIVPFFLQLFACNPMEKFFKPFLPGYCRSQGSIIAVSESFNSFTDLALVVLAMAMIQNLNISRANKARLGVLFGLGALAGVLGIVKIVVTYKGNEFYSFALVGFLSNIQMAAGIICCCVPVLKSLLPAPGLWSRLSSSFLVFSRRRKTNASDSQPDMTPKSARSAKRNQGWRHMHEDGSSMRGISWDVTTHGFETHAMSSMSSTYVAPTEPGIQVQKQVIVNHEV